MKMKNILIFGLALFLSTNAFSQVPNSVNDSAIDDKLLTELINSPNRKLQNTFLNDEQVKLILTPNTELSEKAISSWTNSENPRFTTENLFFLKKATLFANSDNPQSCDVSIDAVSKVVRSISKMKGIQYYSNGAQKWETLYHKSNLIDSPKTKNPIPDDLSGDVNGKSFYCHQEDNSFGTCIYKLDYLKRTSPNEISVCFTNAESLKYGFITAVKPGNLKLNLVVIEQDTYYLVYIYVQAKYPSIPFLESRLNRSFNARVDAIYKWFTMSF